MGMIPRRGPDDRLHWPSYSKRGCYYGDIAHVCFFCYCRLVWLLLKGAAREKYNSIRR